jgi:hypothetical protein
VLADLDFHFGHQMWKNAWTCIKKALPECDRHDVSKAYVELLLVRMEAMCFRVLFSDQTAGS